MSYQFADVEDYCVDIDHYDINVSDGAGYVNSLDVTVEQIEIGSIIDWDEFLSWCKEEGMTVDKDSNGQIVIYTAKKKDENDSIVDYE